MFLRKIKYEKIDSSVPFVRFLNEFESQKSLFTKEGIELDSKFVNEIMHEAHSSLYRNIQRRKFV